MPAGLVLSSCSGTLCQNRCPRHIFPLFALGIIGGILVFAGLALESIVKVYGGTGSGDKTEDGLVHIHEHLGALSGLYDLCVGIFSVVF